MNDTFSRLLRNEMKEWMNFFQNYDFAIRLSTVTENRLCQTMPVLPIFGGSKFKVKNTLYFELCAYLVVLPLTRRPGAIPAKLCCEIGRRLFADRFFREHGQGVCRGGTMVFSFSMPELQKLLELRLEPRSKLH